MNIRTVHIATAAAALLSSQACAITVEVAPGEIGELCFENPYVRGYINLPEETAKAFVDGIYHTGDLGIYNHPDIPGFESVHRSVCVDYLYYNEDGTIRPVVPTVSEEKLKNNTAFK